MLITKSIRSYVNTLKHVDVVLLVHCDRLVSIAMTGHFEVSARMSILIDFGCAPLVGRIMLTGAFSDIFSDSSRLEIPKADQDRPSSVCRFHWPIAKGIFSPLQDGHQESIVFDANPITSRGTIDVPLELHDAFWANLQGFSVFSHSRSPKLGVCRGWSRLQKGCGQVQAFKSPISLANDLVHQLATQN